MAGPKKIQTIVAEFFKEEMILTARKTVADKILPKLAQQNINVEGFPIDELLDHIFSGSPNTFYWDDGNKANKSISIEMTSDEVDAICKEIDSFIKKSEDVLLKGMEAAAKVLVRQLLKDHNEQQIYYDIEQYGFRKSLEIYWGKGLSLLRAMLFMAHEVYVVEAESLAKSKAKKGVILREALIGIQARTLRTSTAVLVLLENGLADDAYARWRTLYELSVVAAFISTHGEEAAERYLEHECVSLKKRMDNELSWNFKGISKKQQREINEAYDDVVRKHGKDFANHYGWANIFLSNNPNPKFVNLEKSVIGKPIVPPYKESSFQVHGGRAGLLGLSSLDDTEITGYSNAGLHIPLMHTSLALMKTTNLLLYHSPRRDLVMMQVFVVMERKIKTEADRVARKLEQDDKRERK